jgi:hypothetical protein
MTTKRPSLAKSLTKSVEQAAHPQSSVAAATKDEAPASAPATANYRAATRVGKKKVTAPLNPESHKLLRQLALDNGTTVEALLLEAIRDLFAKHGKPPIA